MAWPIVLYLTAAILGVVTVVVARWWRPDGKGATYTAPTRTAQVPPPPAAAVVPPVAPPPETTTAVESAAAVQRQMAPAGVLRVPGFAITGATEAVDACGGDWWWCHAIGDGRVVLAVGDATGHGLGAAMVAAATRGVVEGAVRGLGTAITPDRVIEIVAASMARLGDDAHVTTCAVVLLDPAIGSASVASAGHPFPYVRRGATGRVEVLAARGTPLGTRTVEIGAAYAWIEPGDVLVLCSDGVAERASASGRRFGARRLRDTLSQWTPEPGTRVRRLRSEIMGAVHDFAHDAALDDDLTVVVCEFRERIGMVEMVEGAVTERMQAATA